MFKKDIFTKKIKYTNQMKEQDFLWQNAKEDLRIMFSLQQNILEQAKALGWQGYAITYEVNNEEVVTDVYLNKEDIMNF